MIMKITLSASSKPVTVVSAIKHNFKIKKTPWTDTHSCYTWKTIIYNYQKSYDHEDYIISIIQDFPVTFVSAIKHNFEIKKTPLSTWCQISRVGIYFPAKQV